jgi:hypothetical protein
MFVGGCAVYHTAWYVKSDTNEVIRCHNRNDMAVPAMMGSLLAMPAAAGVYQQHQDCKQSLEQQGFREVSEAEAVKVLGRGGQGFREVSNAETAVRALRRDEQSTVTDHQPTESFIQEAVEPK